jgi:hypothetical protein
MLHLGSVAEVEPLWLALDRRGGSLPLQLRLPQRDALFYILQRRHVLLNVATGVSVIINSWHSSFCVAS